MEVRTREAYRTDLTDDQWAILEPLVPAARPGGRERIVNVREIINTILYLIRTGCQWDRLPTTYKPGVPPTTTLLPGATMAHGNVC